jgi:phosphopantetheinyl transferase
MVRLFYTILNHGTANEHAAGRQLLCRVLGCREKDIQIAPDGKPCLPDGPHFNLSHSGGMVLLAVCEISPVGCDVEPRNRTIKNEEAILRKILPDRTISTDRPFLYHWTAHEARFKSGLGEAAHVIYPHVHDNYICAVASLGETYADPIRY